MAFLLFSKESSLQPTGLVPDLFEVVAHSALGVSLHDAARGQVTLADGVFGFFFGEFDYLI